MRSRASIFVAFTFSGPCLLLSGAVPTVVADKCQQRTSTTDSPCECNGHGCTTTATITPTGGGPSCGGCSWNYDVTITCGTDPTCTITQVNTVNLPCEVGKTNSQKVIIPCPGSGGSVDKYSMNFICLPCQ